MQNFYICGPHCAGKTSIISRLTKELPELIPAFEIGKEFYYHREKAGFGTSSADDAFEHEVTDAELKRDREILSRGGTVVESWHPGNLAYVMVRNRCSVTALQTKILQSLTTKHRENVKGFFISVSKENIYQRTKTFCDQRDWAAEFYTEINNVLPEAIDALGLLKRLIVVNGNGTFEETYQHIYSIVVNQLNHY